MIDPRVSWATRSVIINTSFFRTLVVVGQSNSAEATNKLYQNLEIESIDNIESIFGKGQHITALIKEAKSCFTGIITPKLWAIPYADNGSATANILKITTTGTAITSGVIKIKCMSIDQVEVQKQAIRSLRETLGADCSKYAKNSVSRGAPKNAIMPFNPYLSNYYSNFIEVPVQIDAGDTADQLAAKIKTAIDSQSLFLFTATESSPADNIITLTSNNKGTLSNNYHCEVVESTIPRGLTISITQDQVATGVVDITNILTLLNDLDFNYLVLPNSYNKSALIDDAFAKRENVKKYGNACLDYYISSIAGLNLVNDTALNDLSASNSTSEKGVVESISIIEKKAVSIFTPISNYTKITKVGSKSFTPIQLEINGKVSVGNTFTLSNDPYFAPIEPVIASSVFRETVVEKFIPIDFGEQNFTDGTSVNDFTLTKEKVLILFEGYYDIFSGEAPGTPYRDNYFGILDNNADKKQDYLDLLESKLSFEKNTRTLIIELILELTKKIVSLDIIAKYK